MPATAEKPFEPFEPYRCDPGYEQCAELSRACYDLRKERDALRDALSGLLSALPDKEGRFQPHSMKEPLRKAREALSNQSK